MTISDHITFADQQEQRAISLSLSPFLCLCGSFKFELNTYLKENMFFDKKRV